MGLTGSTDMMDGMALLTTCGGRIVSTSQRTFPLLSNHSHETTFETTAHMPGAKPCVTMDNCATDSLLNEKMRIDMTYGRGDNAQSHDSQFMYRCYDIAHNPAC